MKIKISKKQLNNIILEEYRYALEEIKAGEINLDPKKDTTEADDDLLNLITKRDLANNTDYIILLNNGYIPVNKKSKDGGWNARIGAGVQGTVYEATKMGTDKRYAVKITEDAGEIKVRNKIEDLRKSLPAAVSKYFIKVHDIKLARGKITPEIKDLMPGPKTPPEIRRARPSQDTIIDKYMIVMDLVRPMNDVEKKILYNGIGSLERFLVNFKIKDYAANWDLFLNLLKEHIGEDRFDFGAGLLSYFKTHSLSNVKSGLPGNFSEQLNIFNKAIVEQLYAACGSYDKELINIWHNSFKHLNPPDMNKNALTVAYEAALKNIGPYVAKLMVKNNAEFYKQIDKQLGLDSKKSLSDPKTLFVDIINSWEQFSSSLAFTFTDYIKSKLGSKSGEFKMVSDFHGFLDSLHMQLGRHANKSEILSAFDQLSANMTENAAGFIRALLTIAVEHGVEWNDLHSGNVMIDPENGNYLAVDVGLFEI